MQEIPHEEMSAVAFWLLFRTNTYLFKLFKMNPFSFILLIKFHNPFSHCEKREGLLVIKWIYSEELMAYILTADPLCACFYQLNWH